MKTRILFLIALAACAFSAESHAQSTAFTYQGRLNQNNSPVQGIYDLQFAIHDAASGGTPLNTPVTRAAVGVTNGLFTVLLDFGSGTFSGADRWLDIAVRPAGSATFTALTPRQPITPTPYAITALTAKQVPGVSGNALHAADGNPRDAVFVDNAGHVGIGTTSPEQVFDVRSGDGSYVRVDLPNGDMRVNGGSDGHWGIFNDGPSAGGTHLIGEGQTRMFVANTGDVGVGTITPAAKLDVRGDIRMGAGGQFLAVGGEEGLRMVRGLVNGDGTLRSGSGVTVARAGDGDYRMTFDRPFSAPPVVTASQEFTGSFPLHVSVYEVTRTSAKVIAQFNSQNTGFPRVDTPFHFTAIGPR